MNDREKALILTVGLPGDQGGDVLDALKLDLDTLRPACLVLIASGQSMNNAQRLIERSKLPPEQCEVIQLASAHDMDEVFRQTNRAVQHLIARGFKPEQIAINYTSGTKVMGSGAVLSAVYNKIMELRYITGLAAVRDGDRARHKIISTKPAAVFAYQDLIESIDMMRDLRFQSARRALDGIAQDFLSTEDQQAHRTMIALARAYEDWDNFYPDRFLEVYPSQKIESEALKQFELKEGQIEAIGQIIVERTEGVPGPHILSDLYNNAWRRLLTGRTEDAFARLYRALEMLAQWVLLRDFQIDTNDVQTRKVPPRDRPAYEAMRSLEDGMVKIGLRKAFDLLVILKTPVGQKFQDDSVLRELLEKRAGSVLAHGYTPADPHLAQQFLMHSHDLFRVEIPQFDTLTRLMQFPWLRDRMPD